MKIKHPTIPDMTTDVPKEAVKDWLAQGWLLVENPKRRRS